MASARSVGLFRRVIMSRMAAAFAIASSVRPAQESVGERHVPGATGTYSEPAAEGRALLETAKGRPQRLLGVVPLFLLQRLCRVRVSDAAAKTEQVVADELPENAATVGTA